MEKGEREGRKILAAPEAHAEVALSGNIYNSLIGPKLLAPPAEARCKTPAQVVKQMQNIGGAGRYYGPRCSTP